MTTSKLQRRRIKRALLIVLPVVALLLVALYTGSSVLFERSLRKPISGAYSNAPKQPASAVVGHAKGPAAATPAPATAAP